MSIALSFDPDQVLSEFIQLECRNYPIDAINILHQHPEVFKLKLLELLQSTDTDDDRCIVALFTLAKYRAKEAYPIIIKLLRLAYLKDDDFLGDLITEDIPVILAACFDGNLNQTKELIFTKDIDCYARLAPILSLKYLVATKQISLAQAMGFIEEIAEVIINEGYDEDLESGNILELILNTLTDFSVPQYDEFALRTNWKPQEATWAFDFERELKYLREKYPSEDSSYYKYKELDSIWSFEQLITEGILSVSSWVGVKVEEDDDEIDFNYLPIIRSPKIGRNDPCPCNSGKKYKKCCINDET